MRWLRALAIAGALVAAVGGHARADGRPTTPGWSSRRIVSDDSPGRLAAVERTIDQLAVREREHRAQMTERVRAASKAMRRARVRAWLDPDDRRAALVRRAALARLLRRDVDELAILTTERDASLRARDALRAELAATAAAAPPAPRSLARPVARARVVRPFGRVRDRDSGAELSSRGVELRARPGDAVLAVADGRIRWIGALAGRHAVLIEHDGFVSILAGLAAPPATARGQAVARGQELARAAGDVYLEIRLQTGAFGQPVDPAPLLERDR